MKKFRLYILALFFPLTVSTATINDNHGDTLRIGVIGDQTGSHDLDSTYRILEKAVNKISNFKPEIVLHVGDLVESIKGINNYEDYHSNFNSAVNILNQLSVRWYLTAGDHDVNPPGFKSASIDRSREEWFKKSCNSAGLPIENDLYYSFDLKGYHFISLYSLENLHTDPRWGPIFLNKLSPKQIEWLKKDLKKHETAKGIIVFMHHPHWYVWSNWSEIHAILRKYPVAGVIAGHYHYDQDEGLIDNIHYLVVGATGGVVKNTDKHSGGAPQFAILKLIKNKITEIKIHDLSSDSLLELTPRKSMDRIQALSCMLDNIYMDENMSRKNGQLYTISGAGEYTNLEKIGLESLSNPIDLPIKIEINSESEVLQNSNQSYFELMPGERIGWSNYTNVGQWFKPKPLWVCDVKQDSLLINQLKGININIKISFQDQIKRWIKSTVFYPIKEYK